MTPQRYRKRPVVIEAVQYDPLNQIEAVRFLGGPDGPWSNSMGFRIRTLEGDMLVTPGDWIIRGVKGEFYPCKPDVFEATYEAVDEVEP